jgi:ribose-phosphate pyrophosphokinase
MAEFAKPTAPMRRLFFRIDFAPQPQNLILRRVLGHWQVRRGGDIYPSRDALHADTEGADRAHVFTFDRIEDDEFRLDFGGAVLAELLGPIETGDLLSKFEARRIAVRLRRLFLLIELRGEPLVAGFEARLPDGSPVDVEILVAPTSADHTEIETIFGAIAITPTPDRTASRDDE